MTFWKKSHFKTKGILGKGVLKKGSSLEIFEKKRLLRGKHKEREIFYLFKKYFYAL